MQFLLILFIDVDCCIGLILIASSRQQHWHGIPMRFTEYQPDMSVVFDMMEFVFLEKIICNMHPQVYVTDMSSCKKMRNPLFILKDSRTKWSLIMRETVSGARGRIIFSLSFLKSPRFPLHFALLFGTTFPYFSLERQWKPWSSPKVWLCYTFKPFDRIKTSNKELYLALSQSMSLN